MDHDLQPTDAHGDAIPAFSSNVLRYGREDALPERRELRTGPLTAILEGGDLRHVRLAGESVVLRLYGAVRDRNWGTVEPRFTRYEVEDGDDGFRVSYTAECVEGDVDFAWEGELRGTPDGVITASFEGEARKPFLRNRIGWCVLHPLAAAGQPAETETPDGPVAGAFPSAISPDQPFFDMQSISHPTANGGRVTIRFEGDLFEMEDQRNWTDASFKTYSTPLRIPYPVEVRPGERVRQTVTIEGHAPAGFAETTGGGAGPSIRVGPEAVATMPPIGLGAASHGKPLSQNDLDRLAAMHLGHLRLELDLTTDGWRDKLALVAGEAAALNAPLEIAAVAGDAGEGIDDLFRALADGAVPLARVLVFPTTDWTTTEPVLATALAARDAAGVGAPVGGGSRTFFTEFNRAQATMPLAAMEVVGFPIVPTVHAIDNGSVMETILAQPSNVESAKLIAPGKPVAVGPISLRMPFNPNATGPEPELAPGQLPPTVDERQPSLFAAAWTAGSVGALSRAGVAALTYFQTNGWRGVMEREDHPLRVPGFNSWPGMTFPVYHVLADLAQFSGGDVLPVDLGDPLAVAVAAVKLDGRVRVLVANLQDESRRLSLTLPIRGDLSLRRLDETTMMAAAADPATFRAATDTVPHSYGTFDLDLSPYAVLTIEGQASD